MKGERGENDFATLLLLLLASMMLVLGGGPGRMAYAHDDAVCDAQMAMEKVDQRDLARMRELAAISAAKTDAQFSHEIAYFGLSGAFEADLQEILRQSHDRFLRLHEAELRRLGMRP